jgi:hypothetical protein
LSLKRQNLLFSSFSIFFTSCFWLGVAWVGEGYGN